MKNFEEYWDKQYKNGKTPEDGHKEVAGKAWETALPISPQTEQAEASSLSDGLDAEAELKRLFDTVEQVIKTSKPVEPLGVVCSSRAAWQALMNAYEFYKAEGI